MGRSLAQSIQICIDRESGSGATKEKGLEIQAFFASVSAGAAPDGRSLEEGEVARDTEVHHVRNDERHVSVAHAQPARERRGVLVDRDARHRVSLPDVDVGAEGGRSEGSVYFVAENRPAEREVMRAPAVIGPVAVRANVASGIGGGA